ncbi:hypothetical protein EUTSA_v10015250mg [Eutrema salsugineum]|uniref:Uncharacterized protein n=1 Tax=Eutrema salsugineum TaxID=72664 RepID=V4LSS8_EUTSA|nr:uncharacterized protein LOC18016529 [Eutrema salsugineum]ESQ42943.1 hypothetical protein EUTSA_v10015250mg [Eutrema salsugineum]
MLVNYVNPKLISKANIRSCIYSLYLKRGSASGGREEGRAPSTAEEFTRQGVASQTVEKAYDGAVAAVSASGDTEAKMEKVKEEFCEKEEGRDYHKKVTDKDGLPINTS